MKWVNAEASIPNGIPTLSSGSNMVYAIGARDGVWVLEGLDMTTEASRLRVETGTNATHNSFYADTQIAPDGTVTGTFGGVDILRPADPNAPLRLRCLDRRHTYCRLGVWPPAGHRLATARRASYSAGS